MRNVSTEATRQHDNKSRTGQAHRASVTTQRDRLLRAVLQRLGKPGRETDVDVQTFWHLVSLTHPRFRRSTRPRTSNRREPTALAPQLSRRYCLAIVALALLHCLLHRLFLLRAWLRMIRPGFPRHLKAMENGRFGGVYEQQAVYG
ncbi:hypothetical protein EIQ13_19330 [Xanthomonas campestris pv. campestris]